MPREKEDYRDILTALHEHFGADATLLTIKDVAEYLHIQPATVKSRYGITKRGVMVQSLARMLCQ